VEVAKLLSTSWMGALDPSGFPNGPTGSANRS
jgi:hypothetical protein